MSYYKNPVTKLGPSEQLPPNLQFFDRDADSWSRLVVSASSGRQDSLSNMTVVEVVLVDDNDLAIGLDGGVVTNLAPPTSVGTNLAVAATGGGIADWALGLLIALLLLVVAFGSVFLFLHLRGRKHKKPAAKPGLNGDSNATASNNSYVDPSAFDTIPIRSVVAGNAANSNASNGNPGNVATCQFAPPKYDEIPPYGTSGAQAAQQQQHTVGIRSYN